MNWTDWYKAILALVVWREARGEGHDGMRAVAHVIYNRVQAGHTDWASIIEAKWQFSSLTAPGDPMLVQWPKPPDPAFEDAMSIVDLIYNGNDFDLTYGATHYFNPNVVKPAWAASLTKVASIGHHDFYR